MVLGGCRGSRRRATGGRPWRLRDGCGCRRSRIGEGRRGRLLRAAMRIEHDFMRSRRQGLRSADVVEALRRAVDDESVIRIGYGLAEALMLAAILIDEPDGLDALGHEGGHVLLADFTIFQTKDAVDLG